MIPVQDPVKIYPGPILANVSLPTNFKFVSNTHVKVRINHADSTSTELVYGTHYTVTGEGTDSGAIKLVTGTTVVTNDNLIIYLDIPFSQPTSYKPVTRFPSDLIEKQLDILTLVVQSLNEKITRACTVPILATNFSGEMPVPVPGKAIKVNASGTGFEFTSTDIDSTNVIVEAALAAIELLVPDATLLTGKHGLYPKVRASETGFDYYNLDADIAAAQSAVSAAQSAVSTVQSSVASLSTSLSTHINDPIHIDIFSSRLLHLQDQKAAGTHGGTFTAGAWQKRDLNTSLTNQITGASLASNVITLPAGTYHCEAIAPAANVGYHKARLYKTSGTAGILLNGTNEYSYPGYSIVTYSKVSGRFTLAAESTIELQHQCISTRDTEGLGWSCNFGTEVYSDIRLWKVA